MMCVVVTMASSKQYRSGGADWNLGNSVLVRAFCPSIEPDVLGYPTLSGDLVTTFKHRQLRGNRRLIVVLGEKLGTA